MSNVGLPIKFKRDKHTLAVSFVVVVVVSSLLIGFGHPADNTEDVLVFVKKLTTVTESGNEKQTPKNLTFAAPKSDRGDRQYQQLHGSRKFCGPVIELPVS